MTVTFSIRNVTDNLADTVMLRKFFQMVFVGNDHKSLDIYTATVLGGSMTAVEGGKENDSNENLPQDISGEKSTPLEAFVSRLDCLKAFCVKFGFVVTGNDDNDVLSITSENITEDEHGFLAQIDCIQQVWGKQCKVLCNDQTELTEAHERFMRTHSENWKAAPELTPILAQMSQNRILLIEDENKKHEPYMCSVALPGCCKPEDYHLKEEKAEKVKRRKPVDEGSEKAFYCITVPADQACCEGVELLNWVKTTITFQYRLNDQNLNFSIKKEPAKTRFIAPDFTWYFSPPVKSYINHESSCAEANWQRKKELTCNLHKNCNCPVKPDIEAQYTSKRYDNAINPVANKTTVNFYRWLEDEMIGYRQKYRIASKNIFPRPESFDDIRELNIFIDTSDEHNRGNRQYVLGLLISFALAFGIDKTRLRDAQKYFPFENLFLADTWWLLLIISLSMNLLIRPPRNIQERKYTRWRKRNIISSLSWIIFVFCFDQSKWLTDFFNVCIGSPLIRWIEHWGTFDINFCWIPQIIFVAVLFSNICYVWRNIRKYHDPILSGLFDDDIL